MVIKVKNKIQKFRKAEKFSQEEVAKLCGVSRQTINAVENDKYDPSLSLAFDLAKVLKTTVDELFNPDEK